MKRICEFCKKKYEVDISLGNWDKENNQIIIKGKGQGNKTKSSKRFCCYECGIKYKEKKKELTSIKKYGISKYNNREKAKKTNLEKYGVEYSIQNKDIREKQCNTMLQRYGVKYSAQSKEIQNKFQNTCLKKYGTKTGINYKNITNIKKKKNNGKYLSDESINKIKQTNLEKYGTYIFSKSQKYKDLFKDKNWLKNKQEKEYNTKKTNNSFNSSKPEEEIYKLLVEKYSKVERQYKSEKYPFNCDFYIPELDLYIEINFHWTHSTKPYNPKDRDCIELVNKWRNKNTKFYNKAIEVYTIRDFIKRKTAEENNLNWIEFFNMEEFYIWYRKLIFN